jgi:tetratricopeptide (TPR) repeat protein
MYHCKSANCPINESGAGFPAPMPCPVCGKMLVRKGTDADRQTPASSGRLIDRLPFPIAYPWHNSLETGLDPVMRVNNMIFTAYQAMRVTGLLLLSGYLESDESCLTLGKPLAKMRMPHWGEWKTLTDSLANYLSGNNPKYKPKAQPDFAWLAHAWREMRVKWKEESHSGKFAKGKNVPGPAEIFQDLRNNRAHRQGVQDGTGDEPRILELYLPVLEFMLEFMFGRGDIQLLRLPVSGTSHDENIQEILADSSSEFIPSIHLNGVHPDFHFEVEDILLNDILREALQKSSLIALHGDNVLPVYPFFLALDRDAPDSGGMIEPVTMVDAFSEKKVAYLGVKTHGAVAGLGEKVVELLGKKNHALGLSREGANRWMMVEWTQDNAGATLANMTMKKYFPQCYIDRPADRGLISAVQRPDKALVISGEAGSGKSSLLCRFVENLLRESAEKQDHKKREKHFQKKVRGKDLAVQSALDAFMALKGAGDVVIFLSGRPGVPVEKGESMERAFCRALLWTCGVKESEFNTPMDFIRRLDENVTAPDKSPKKDDNEERKVWIILDAINEVDRFRDFAGVIDRFMLETAAYPWLRVICSMRTGSLDALQAGEQRDNIHGPLPFSHETAYQIFTNQYTAGPREEPRLDIPLFTEKETRLAYETRQRELPELAALNSYDSLQPDFCKMLSSPLYFHVFHETWKGEKADLTAITGGNALFEAYLNSLEKDLPGIRDTLKSIGDHMYNHETPFWPEEEAWNFTEKWVRDKHVDSVMHVCTLTPVETLVSASLLMRPTDDEQAYQFSHQKICEQILKRVLEKEWQQAYVQAKSADELTQEEQKRIKTLFQSWFEKAARFDWLANAAADLFASWLHNDNNCLLALLPGVTGLVDTTMETICQAIFLEMCSLNILDASCLSFIEAGFQPGPQYTSFWNALNRTNVLATRTGKSRNIAAIIQASLTFHERLVDLKPERMDLNRDLAVSYNNVGHIYKEQGKTDKALACYKKSIIITERLVAQEPEHTDVNRNLWISYINVGRIYRDQGKVDKAMDYFEDSLAIMDRLVYLEPARMNFMQYQADSCDGLASAYETRGGIDEEALVGYKKSLTIRMYLVSLDPGRTDFHQDLASSYNNVGRIYYNHGQGDKALDYVEESLAVREQLVFLEPERTDFNEDLAASYNNIGLIYRTQGKKDEAQGCYEKAIAIMERLVALEPERMDLNRDLSVLYENVG